MPKIVDHEEQRRLLSATVADVIAHSGLEHTTLRTVAANHGCTKGMVQHYFADKDELLLAALVFIEHQCEQRIPAADAGLNGLEWLQAILQAQLPLTRALLREAQVRLAFNSQAPLSTDIRKTLIERQAELEKLGLKAMRQAQRSGELKPGLSLPNSYRSLQALVAGLLVGAIREPARWSAATQRQILKTAIDDLRP